MLAKSRARVWETKLDACEDDTILLMPLFILCFDYIINKTVCLYGNQKYFENFKIYIVSCNRVCYNLNCYIVFGGKQYGALL